MTDLQKLGVQCLIALVACLATLLIAGCAGGAAVEQKVVTVKVKVVEPCIERAPERPEYQTGHGDYPGEKAAAMVLADDFEKAEQYGHSWEAAAAGCIVVPPR